MQFKILNKSEKMQALEVHLKADERLPLHDHPQTQVFMYVLYGKLKVDFYRYLGANSANKTIELATSQTMGSGSHELITVQDVNLHQITAVEDSAFLDIMLPGYFENPDIQPTWLESYEEQGFIKVREIPQPLDVAKAKQQALAAFEKS